MPGRKRSIDPILEVLARLKKLGGKLHFTISQLQHELSSKYCPSTDKRPPLSSKQAIRDNLNYLIKKGFVRQRSGKYQNREVTELSYEITPSGEQERTQRELERIVVDWQGALHYMFLGERDCEKCERAGACDKETYALLAKTLHLTKRQFDTLKMISPVNYRHVFRQIISLLQLKYAINYLFLDLKKGEFVDIFTRLMTFKITELDISGLYPRNKSVVKSRLLFTDYELNEEN